MDVPKELCHQVADRVEEEIVGKLGRFCDGCGERIFFGSSDFCWRCDLDDTYKEEGVVWEAAARKAAARLAANGLGNFYANTCLDREETDLDLLDAAIRAAIEAEMQGRELCLDDDEVVAEFVYRSGYGSFGVDRCRSFLDFANYIVQSSRPEQ